MRGVGLVRRLREGEDMVAVEEEVVVVVVEGGGPGIMGSREGRMVMDCESRLFFPFLFC